MENLDWSEEAAWCGQARQRVSFLRQALGVERERLRQAEIELEGRKAAQEILQRLAQQAQQQAHRKIAEVVSLCLSSVFDEAYEFQIHFERKRGRTEARLAFVRNDQEHDPLTASGGGVVDVASFALRAAALMLHRPRLSRVLVLDEPFRFVSARHQAAVRGVLEQLSKDLKMQILFVTHNERLATGQVVEIE